MLLDPVGPPKVLQQTGEPNRNRKTEPELNRNRMNRTGKPNRLNRTGTELEPNPKGHEIYHFDQNFKPAFTPLNLVQSSPSDL